jgi:hypothetical protein
MGGDRQVMLVSGLFLGFVLGIVFVEVLGLSLDVLYQTARDGEMVELVSSPPESRGDAVAAESKDE